MTNEASNISSLSVVDWNRSRRVSFEGEIESDSLVSEVVAEAIHKLNLPTNVPYSAVHDGRKLNSGATLAEAELGTDAEIMVTPEVSAGAG